MPGVGLGTVNIDVSFQEVMTIATVMTFLLMIYYSAVFLEDESLLALPHALIQSFNVLWFDDFKFLVGVGTSSCGGSIENASRHMLTTDANPDDPVSVGLGSLQLLAGILGTGLNVFLSCGVSGLRLVLGSAIILYWLMRIAQILGGFASFFDLIGKIIR